MSRTLATRLLLHKELEKINQKQKCEQSLRFYLWFTIENIYKPLALQEFFKNVAISSRKPPI